MSAPLLQSATYNLVTGQLTLVFDVAVDFAGSAGDLMYQRSTLIKLANITGPDGGSGFVTMVFSTASGTFTTLTDGTLSFDAGTFQNSLDSTNCAAVSDYFVELVGGPTPDPNAPVIGTYDEYVTVYKANSNPLSAGASQDQIQLAIDATNEQVRRFTGVDYGDGGPFVESLNGTGSHTIRVKNPPITSVSSIVILYPSGSTYTLPASSYRWTASGTIQRSVFGTGLFAYTTDAEVLPGVEVGDVSQFPAGFQNVVVTYTGGYAAAPTDLRMAVYEIVDEYLFRAGVRGTDKAPLIAELVSARGYRLRPFERIVM